MYRLWQFVQNCDYEESLQKSRLWTKRTVHKKDEKIFLREVDETTQGALSFSARWHGEARRPKNECRLLKWKKERLCSGVAIDGMYFIKLHAKGWFYFYASNFNVAFLVADTRLYTLLCRSIRRSVCHIFELRAVLASLPLPNRPRLSCRVFGLVHASARLNYRLIVNWGLKALTDWLLWSRYLSGKQICSFFPLKGNLIPVQPFLERRPARLLLREREVKEVREMMAKASQNKGMSSMKRATKVVQEKLNQVTETKKN